MSALGDVDEDVAAEHAGLVDLVPDHQLPDQFGEAEGEDDEMQPAQPQRRNPDDTAISAPIAAAISSTSGQLNCSPSTATV